MIHISPLSEYERKKQQLVSTIKKGANPQLRKKTSNLFRERGRIKSGRDVRAFNKVLSIDEEAMLCEVEGMITYDEFVRTILPFGYLPTVVPQLKTITVGGALTGLGIESSSFRYGLVHETVEEIEVLLASGSVVTCTPRNEYKDLFFAFPNSYGTLGYALKIKVKIIPAKPFVKIEHKQYTSASAFFKEIEATCKQGAVDYVDGSIFSRKKFIVSKALFADSAPATSNYTYMHAYFTSVQTKKIDYLKTYDYIWRWDADWFWCSKHFGMHNPFLRFLLGPWLLHSAVYWKLMKINQIFKVTQRLDSLRTQSRRETVIQDVEIPLEKAGLFFSFFIRHIGILPIWVCPIKPHNNNRKYPLYLLDPKKLYINFGFWDTVPSPGPGIKNRMIEKKVLQLGGMKSLYSESFFSPQEFWKTYNGIVYWHVKKKYDPLGKLKDLYEKTVKRR